MGFSQEYKCGDFFVLRTPLLSFDEYSKLSENLEASKAINSPEELPTALKNDRLRIRSGLQKIYEQPEVCEALWIASPDLYHSIKVWREDPDSERGQKVELSLYRYFIRMATRPTPFALFSGYSIGTIGNKTEFELAGKETLKRNTQIHIEFLSLLVDKILADPKARDTLLFSINSTLYFRGEQLKYARYSVKDQKREHQIVTVDSNPFIQFIFAQSLTGTTISDLANALIRKYPHLSLKTAKQFINDLIDTQILLPEIIPLVTGSDPMQEIIEQLKLHQETKNWAALLNDIRDELCKLDSLGVGLDPEEYKPLEEYLQNISEKNSSKYQQIPYPIQINLSKQSLKATLDQSVASEILQSLKLLQRLGCFASYQHLELQQFRDEFLERYEEQEIPLVTALDSEIGVGFRPANAPFYEISRLLEDPTLPDPPPSTSIPIPIQMFITRKLENALFAGDFEVTLRANELEALPNLEHHPIPDSFSAMATIIASSKEAISKGDYRVLLNGGTGPSGAVLLGRLCQSDPELLNRVEKYLREEESLAPDPIFAEFVYLPPDFTGTLVIRPVFREYEIPYFGHSGAPIEKQIPITDLLVSVRSGRVILRSARLGREIIPCRTSPLVFPRRAHFLPVVHFLFALQRLYIVLPIWGEAGNNAPFLPRVVSGKVVLSPAMWRLSRDELEKVRKTSNVRQFQQIQVLRTMKKLPRFVVIGQGDNLIPLDLENVLGTELFSHLAEKEEKELVVRELFPDSSNLCVTGPGGLYRHDFVLPLLATNKSTQESSISHPYKPLQTRRIFPPGSEWLFIKLYAHPSVVDKILIESVRPIIKEVLSADLVDGWFFIRYSDPKWHLRLRFHGDPKILLKKVVPIVQKYLNDLIEAKFIWRVQYDTYHREIERYGGDQGILLSEKVFQIDSDAVAAILEILSSSDDLADTRWRIALCGIDLLLHDMGFDLKTKRSLLKGMFDFYGKRFSQTNNRALKERVATRFRKERKNLEELLAFEDTKVRNLDKSIVILKRRSKRLKPIFQKLKKLSETGELSLTPQHIAMSYVHMHVNRILKGIVPMEESTLYFFLAQLYTGQIEKMKGEIS